MGSQPDYINVVVIFAVVVVNNNHVVHIAVDIYMSCQARQFLLAH